MWPASAARRSSDASRRQALLHQRRGRPALGRSGTKNGLPHRGQSCSGITGSAPGRATSRTRSRHANAGACPHGTPSDLALESARRERSSRVHRGRRRHLPRSTTAHRSVRSTPPQAWPSRSGHCWRSASVGWSVAKVMPASRCADATPSTSLADVEARPRGSVGPEGAGCCSSCSRRSAVGAGCTPVELLGRRNRPVRSPTRREPSRLLTNPPLGRNDRVEHGETWSSFRASPALRRTIPSRECKRCVALGGSWKSGGR